ncbi:hypothetical protein ACLKA7_007334 [Drosophila subpalustris]
MGISHLIFVLCTLKALCMQVAACNVVHSCWLCFVCRDVHLSGTTRTASTARSCCRLVNYRQMAGELCAAQCKQAINSIAKEKENEKEKSSWETEKRPKGLGLALGLGAREARAGQVPCG